MPHPGAFFALAWDFTALEDLGILILPKPARSADFNPHATFPHRLKTYANWRTKPRTASDSMMRVTPLMIMLIPTSVPIAHAELDGHCI